MFSKNRVRLGPALSLRLPCIEFSALSSGHGLRGRDFKKGGEFFIGFQGMLREPVLDLVLNPVLDSVQMRNEAKRSRQKQSRSRIKIKPLVAQNAARINLVLGTGLDPGLIQCMRHDCLIINL